MMRSHLIPKIILTAAAFAMAALPVAVYAQADQNNYASGPGDYFYLNGPLANSTVSGTIITSWRALDNDQATVPFELTLRDKNCNSLFGTISTGTKPSSSSTDATVSWPSAGPLSDRASIPDGLYCMQLCISLKNGSAPYSACALRQINIRNTNIPPRIVSSPPSNRTITASGSWQYQVQATDDNGDTLTYSLLNAPSFLTVNSATGLIATNNTGKTPATYDVTVVVKDAYGGTASQQFQLIVTAVPVTPPPTPPTPPTPPANQTGSVSINLPTANSELKGKTNQISWTASDPDGIKSVGISYSTDKNTWFPVATLSGDKTSYVWDVSGLKDGDYYLQVTITDNQNAVTSAVSQKFSISNGAAVVPPSATKPLIITVKPEDASTGTDTKPQISGQFTPPVGGTIDAASFSLKLDDSDISSKCTVTATDFTCTLTDPLNVGVHKLHAEVKSTDGQTALREWSFTISSAVTNPTPPPETGNQQPSAQTIVIVLGACCLLALLLLIPWLLYTLWRRRNQDQTQNVYAEPQPVNPSEFSTYADYLSAASQPAPLPEITTNYYTPAPVSTQPVAVAPVVISSPTASQPVMPAAPVIDAAAYTSTPDISSYYTAPTGTGIENADVNVPDWLRGSDSLPAANPLPAAAPEPLVAAPDQPALMEATPSALPEAPSSQPMPLDTNTYVSGLPSDAYVAPLPTMSGDGYVTPGAYPEYAPLPAAASSTQAVDPSTVNPPSPAAPDSGATPDNSGAYGYGRQVDNF